jgi:hypothetical protein
MAPLDASSKNLGLICVGEKQPQPQPRQMKFGVALGLV